jgi:hypothetical protein
VANRKRSNSFHRPGWLYAPHAAAVAQYVTHDHSDDHGDDHADRAKHDREADVHAHAVRKPARLNRTRQGVSDVTLPSESRTKPGLFDRFANGADRFSSRPIYFAMCVVLVILWAATYPLWGNGDTWQLVINTGTTILTFWMVALQRNSDRRDNNAVQHKLNAMLLCHKALLTSHCECWELEVPHDVMRELNDALGLEDHESA